MKFKYLVPATVRSWLRLFHKELDRKLLVFDRMTNWSELRRVTPYRAEFGGRRGKYIDRFYIEKLIATYRHSICGRVAEIQSNEYTKLYGGTAVECSDILDINENNKSRTVTLDLAQTESAPNEVYDCIICTQTLLLIYNYAAAVRTLFKMLKPGGVTLVTVPGICPIVRGNLVAGLGDDWWRFTARSVQRIFSDVFGADNVNVHTYGNVLSATAFLHGLVQEELTEAELEHHDPDYELIIGVCAMKGKVQ